MSAAFSPIMIDGRVGVARGDRRHDRGVGDPQALRCRARAAAHRPPPSRSCPSCRCRPGDRSSPPRRLTQAMMRRPAPRPGRALLRHLQRLHRRRGHDRAGDADRLHRQLGIDRRRQEVEGDRRRLRGSAEVMWMCPCSRAASDGRSRSCPTGARCSGPCGPGRSASSPSRAAGRAPRALRASARRRASAPPRWPAGRAGAARSAAPGCTRPSPRACRCR